MVSDLEKVKTVLSWCEKFPDFKNKAQVFENFWDKLDDQKSQGLVPRLTREDRQTLDRFINEYKIDLSNSSIRY